MSRHIIHTFWFEPSPVAGHLDIGPDYCRRDYYSIIDRCEAAEMAKLLAHFAEHGTLPEETE